DTAPGPAPYAQPSIPGAFSDTRNSSVAPQTKLTLISSAFLIRRDDALGDRRQRIFALPVDSHAPDPLATPARGRPSQPIVACASDPDPDPKPEVIIGDDPARINARRRRRAFAGQQICIGWIVGDLSRFASEMSATGPDS